LRWFVGASSARIEQPCAFWYDEYREQGAASIVGGGVGAAASAKLICRLGFLWSCNMQNQYKDVNIMKRSFSLWYRSLGGRAALFDGGFGTQLQARGLPAGKPPALWNLERPDVVEEVHRAYIRAGCDIVTANTFSANPWALGDAALAEETMRAGVRIAKRAVAAEGRGIVALDVGPSGHMIDPYGDLLFDDAAAGYERVIRAGARENPDVILLETFTDAYEAKAAVVAAQCARLPILVSCSFGDSGRLLSGENPAALVPMLEGMGVSAIGANCGAGPEGMREVVEQLARAASVPIFANPNAGLPERDGDQFVYRLSAETFAAQSVELLRAGARMLGGCCGTAPEHISALREALHGITVPPVVERRTCTVTSGAHAYTIGKKPMWIADRILPVRDEKLFNALANRDFDLLIDAAQEIEEQGAHAINVDVSGVVAVCAGRGSGLSEEGHDAPLQTDSEPVPVPVSEAELFSQFIPALQSVVKLPLSIDTADPVALEAALRAYRGKPIINAMDGTQASMDAVLPLVKRYGGVIIAKLRDEEGVPKTPELRANLAQKIASAAHAAGISKRGLWIDPLVQPVRTHMNALYSAITSTKLIHDRVGTRVVLGVSNFSLGKTDRPRREAMFLSHALDVRADVLLVNMRSKTIAMTARSADD
jgi:5-methyltetrahydrofolate--homocysteine methyltransferase